MADEPSELRQFMREFLVRFDRIMDAHIERIDAGTAQLRKLTAEMSDHRDETRAQTQAILRLLDRMSRFGGNGGEAPA
ncbi:MAG: hypothetical protein ACJ76Z_05355 [Thermoleophilaceae bacterium]